MRTYISMVKMMRRSQKKMDVVDPDRKHLVSSVNDGADQLKKKPNKGHMMGK